MKTKYEVIQISQAEITVDVSLLFKTEEMFFNATQMAKVFGKTPKDFLKTGPTKEYIQEIFKEDSNPFKTIDDIVSIKRGKHGGTWFHQELAFEFAGWCSPVFRRKLHKWAEDRLRAAADWKRKRLAAKTGFLPMTEAILKNHDPAMPYHFSNEADLINRIVLGMSAKKYRKIHGVDDVREAVSAAELAELERLQRINTGLIEVGMDYQERKDHLIRCHQKELILLGEEPEYSTNEEVPA